MSDRAEELIRSLNLESHPEGGWYSEAFRSPHIVRTSSGDRAALTTIYFLLVSGQKSRWHRIDADEVWHFYEGAGLELIQTSDLHRIHRVSLGPSDAHHVPVAVVPRGMWQAARTTGDYTLVGCTVAPGFEFSRFELLADDAASAERLGDLPPEIRRYL